MSGRTCNNHVKFKYRINIYACIINIQVTHEVKNQRALASIHIRFISNIYLFLLIFHNRIHQSSSHRPALHLPSAVAEKPALDRPHLHLIYFIQITTFLSTYIDRYHSKQFLTDLYKYTVRRESMSFIVVRVLSGDSDWCKK